MYNLIVFKPDGSTKRHVAKTYDAALAMVNGFTDPWQSDVLSVVALTSGGVHVYLTRLAAERLKERFAYEAIQEQRYDIRDNSVNSPLDASAMGLGSSAASPVTGMRGPGVADNF